MRAVILVPKGLVFINLNPNILRYKNLTAINCWDFTQCVVLRSKKILIICLNKKMREIAFRQLFNGTLGLYIVTIYTVHHDINTEGRSHSQKPAKLKRDPL